MKNRLFAIILPTTLAISLTLTACGTDNKALNNVQSGEVNNSQNEGANNSQNEEATDESQTLPKENNDEGIQVEDDGVDQKLSVADVIKEVKQMLVMKGAIIPASFPLEDGYHLTAAIKNNEAQSYEVTFYETKEVTPIDDKSLTTGTSAKAIATFKANTYEDPNKDTDIFFPIDTEGGPVTVDLGYGIKGSAEGAAGHSYLSWSEGNWILTIDSPSEDQMNNEGIAKKMVSYLEDNYLPAPKDKGRVKVNYLPGGNDVLVGIYWQDGNVIYELETDEVPIDAMGMVVSNRS